MGAACVEVVPSPKSQRYPTTLSSTLTSAVKGTVKGKHPFCGMFVSCTCGCLTRMNSFLTNVSVQPLAPVTISFTVYKPNALYTCCGLAAVLVLPSPKSHVLLTTPAVVLVNWIDAGILHE